MGITPSAFSLVHEGIAVLCIPVYPHDQAISYKGRYYSRSGSTGQELKGSSLHQFLSGKLNLSWDEQICRQISFNRFDNQSVERYKILAMERLPEISPTSSIEIILEKLRLTKSNRYPNAAVLLLGTDPQSNFIQAQIKVGKFDDYENLISTDLIDGNLLKQIQQTLELLRITDLSRKIEFEGIVRKDRSIIPEMVLREAIFNAIIHRNYSNAVEITIKIFDDRLGVSNPGRLPDDLKIEDLTVEHLSIPRNKLLADCFYKAGLIESWGRGTLFMTRLCADANLPLPEYHQIENTFKVIVYFKSPGEKSIAHNNQLNGGINGGVNDVYIFIRKNPGKRTNEIAKTLQIPARTIEIWLAKLKAESMIKFRGSKKTGGYFARQ